MSSKRLLVLAGRDAGKEFPVERLETVFGRSKQCDVVLNDKAVSRRHFSVQMKDCRVFLTDQGASNGTFVDGRRVDHCFLEQGSIVVAGSSEFTVVDDSSSASSLAAGPAPHTTRVISIEAARSNASEAIVRVGSNNSAAAVRGSGSPTGRGSGSSDARARRDLAILYRASREMGSATSVRNLADAFVELVSQAFEADHVLLVRREGETQFRDLAWRDEGDSPCTPPTRAFLRRVVTERHGEMVQAPPLQGVAPPRQDKAPPLQGVAPPRQDKAPPLQGVAPPRQAMAAPLPTPDEVIGVVYCARRDTTPWNEADLALLTSVADVAGTMLANLDYRLRLQHERGQLQRSLQDASGIIGESKATQEMTAMIGRVAHARTPVLVSGESGTGKELVARALHYRSPRAGGPFIAINCAALPAELAESELFGHEKGAFTGAGSRRRGRFELADTGTLFLDEVGDLSPSVQAKLLRVLECGEVERVGGEKSVSVNVRIVAATNKSLTEEISHGRFREDLYYRLNVISLELEPLRRRKSDIKPLIEHFLERAARDAGWAVAPELSEEARRRLLAYHWPGNIRELKNVIERCVVLSEGPAIEVVDLPSLLATPVDELVRGEDTRLPSLASVEAAHIETVLTRCGGNKKQAAQILGIERATLYAKLKRYAISLD